jgi:O-antigen ligase
MPIYLKKFQGRINDINASLLIVLGFVLPLSVALGSIVGIAIAVLWAIRGSYLEDWQQMKDNPVVLTVFGFFCLHIVGMLWTEDLAFGVEVTLKESLLLLIPVYILFIKIEYEKYYLYSFLAAMTCLVIYSFAIWFKLAPSDATANVYDPAPQMGRISYGVYLTIAIYLLIYFIFFDGAIKKTHKTVYSFMAIIFTIDMFIVKGRAGQIMFFFMIAIAIFQYYKGSVFKAGFVSLAVVALATTILYNANEGFHERLSSAVTGVQNYSINKKSSSAERIAMAANSFEIIKINPIMGVGTGDFRNEYAKVNARNTPELQPTIQPHNMYALEAVQFGILGLLSLISILYAQIRQALKTNNQFQKNLGMSIPLLYAVIMLSDSYLRGHFTTMLFVYFSSLAYADYSVQCRQDPGSIKLGA